ncbi:putative EamA domain-containing protein [Lupinus albus]|uniref:Putative EamA domain-containing protein n=1 Tax=Lupinus albus TaxID=3870 RepID=A0A6A4P7W5_LUPAL|nr:putative EamA domain-containing protein [Lupinus albus]
MFFPSHSTTHCAWTTLTYLHPFTTLSSSSSSTSCNSLFLKRHRFVPFSLHRQSSSTSGKPVILAVNHDSEDDTQPDQNPTRLNQNPTQISEERPNLKSLFGKRYLWRRINFASKKVKSIVLLNGITLVYASNIPIVKEVEQITSPEAFTAVRFAVAVIPFIPFVLRGWRDSHTRNAGIELGFWVSVGYLMQAVGLQTSDAGRASFITAFTVIVVPLLDGMLGAVVPMRTWFGAIVSIIGVGMLESSGSPPSVGDLLNFLSAVFFGIHMLRTEHISRSIGKEKFLTLLGYEICIVALFSTVWYLVGGCINGTLHPLTSSWTMPMLRNWMVCFPWIPAIYTGIFSTSLCLWAEIAAMRDVSATETAIIYSLEPVWGAGFAWFLLGERWGPTGWIGAALVLGGSLTVQLLGAASDSNEGNKQSKKGDDLIVSGEEKGLSTSQILLKSRKDDASDFFK